MSKASKRILVLNPNTSKATTKQMEDACNKIAAPGTTAHGICIPDRPDFSAYKVFSYVDLTICAFESLKIAWQNRTKYDGIVVAGFSDVGVDAMKEMLEIPVLGIAESSYHLAALLGHRFSVLIGTAKWTPPKHDYVKALGVEGKVASFRPYTEWNTNDSFEELKQRLIKVARACIDEDGAEVIVLGGGPLVGYGKLMEAELGIPVIDPTLATFKLMESVIDLGHSHSKVGRWKAPLSELGDTQGAIPYNRAWLDN
jgi:Asp/Glu/hydantoin racemase